MRDSYFIFFVCPVIESAETVIFFNVSKMSLCLDGKISGAGLTHASQICPCLELSFPDSPFLSGFSILPSSLFTFLQVSTEDFLYRLRLLLFLPLLTDRIYMNHTVLYFFKFLFYRAVNFFRNRMRFL